MIQLQESFDLIAKLNLNGRKLSKSHRKIAEYISEHYDKAVYMTAVSLGRAVEVSESTVVAGAGKASSDGRTAF